MKNNNRFEHLRMGTFSLYVSLSFLLASRLIFDMRDLPHATSTHLEDFEYWMRFTPLIIRIAILIPLLIAIAYTVAYFRSKER
ncbi:MAG: hypothetical protein FWG30_09910 [Eubacteriaceae bacterium]|nr:hypothetical protein [Eubacteriaceae bacterium]